MQWTVNTAKRHRRIDLFMDSGDRVEQSKYQQPGRFTHHYHHLHSFLPNRSWQFDSEWRLQLRECRLFFQLCLQNSAKYERRTIFYWSECAVMEWRNGILR